MATSILSGLQPNLRPSLLSFRGLSFAVDGLNLPYYFDNISSWKWKANTPTTALTANETVAGGMNGVFKYFYTEFNINSGEGTVYYGHETPPSPIYTTGTLSSKKVTLTLPATPLNTGFTHFKIYRTDASGLIFYFLNYVAVGTTTYTDDNGTLEYTMPFGKLTGTDSDTPIQDITWFDQIKGNPAFIIASKSRILTLGTLPYTTGTVTVTNGSATVTGSETAWTTALIGSNFKREDERSYVIQAVASGTSLTLSETYKGINGAGKAYEISTDDSLFRWCATDPLTAKPQFWAFPVDNYRFIRYGDDTPLQGGGFIGEQPVLFKKKSHYSLTENGDDFNVMKAYGEIGLGSYWSIVNDVEQGFLYFVTPEGKLYKTDGLNSVDLGVNLALTVDGINTTNIKRCQSVFYEAKGWLMMIYCSRDFLGDGCDRILVYDKATGQWVIWKICANCIAIMEEVDSNGQTIKSQWIGTVGGFIYKLMSGYNLGATTGTLTGTIGSLGTNTLTDLTATFNTTEDGLEDVFCSRFTASGEFIEERRILSNTATVLTMASNWTTAYTAGETYEIGSLRWSWKSKVFDFKINESKEIRKVLLNFMKVLTSRKVRVNFYFSDSLTMPTTPSTFNEFDLMFDPVPDSLIDNRQRFCQIEISGHGTNDPVTISSLETLYQPMKV